jgi:succinate dehydrogenase/fumarate reductase cytochrome b subunit
MTQPSSSVSFLERLTGVVLVLVLLAIGWMTLVTLIPALPRVLSLEVEAAVMIGLLAASLILVSVVALVHTRR